MIGVTREMLSKVLMDVFLNQFGAFWFYFSLEACPTVC